MGNDHNFHAFETALLNALGFDDHVKSLELRIAAGEIPTAIIEKAIWNADTKELDSVIGKYKLVKLENEDE